MTEFILRNKQIFVTGAIIGGIFLLIIFISAARKVGGPTLAPLETESGKITETKTEINPGLPNYKPKGLWSGPLPAQNPEETEMPLEEDVEAPTEILEISYESGGFKPVRSNGQKNQTVVWTNNTDESIFIKQMKDFFPEFEKPVEIAPRGSLEFKLTKTGLWSFVETESGSIGSIFIVLKPQN